VKKIVEELCGMEVSSTQVSRAAEELDEMLSAWRDRELDSYRYIVVDAQYEKVRQNGQVLDAAVLIACGVGADGHRDVLGCSVSLSEAEVHWRSFLASLKDRGLHGIQLIVSDAHEGLRAARQAVFPSVPWQRCHFHLQQNAGQYVPSQAMRGEVAADIRAIFNAPDLDEANHLLDKLVKKYEKKAPKLATWAEENLPEGFTVFSLPPSHRRRLRTTNLVERLNEEIRRRTRVARLFPNEASCLRLVSAVLMEIAEDWQTADKRYLAFED
jgi:transposase-like protein